MVFELVIVIEDEVDEVEDLDDDRDDTGAAFCLDLASSFEVELVFDVDEDDEDDDEDEEEEDDDDDDGRERLATCEATGDLNVGD